MVRTFRELYRYRTLVWYFVVLDLRVRYRGSFLGFLWTLLNPLLLTLVMWAVFTRFARIQENNYALFLLSGLMAWGFFQQSVERSLTSIVGNRALIQKIYVPKLVFPMAVVGSNLVNLVFFFVAYVIIACAAAQRIPVTAFALVPVTMMLFLLSTGGAVFLAALNVFFRDFTHLTGVLMRVLFYLTPIFYSQDIFGPQAANLLKLNPVYYPVVATREVLYYGRIPDATFWGVGFALALVTFWVGVWTFARTQDRFVYYA